MQWIQAQQESDKAIGEALSCGGETTSVDQIEAPSFAVALGRRRSRKCKEGVEKVRRVAFSAPKTATR